MEIYFLVITVMAVSVIFIVSIFFMIGNRISTAGNEQKEELIQLRKKVEALEDRLEEK
ncbi:hypothetical protein [Bacillus sp. Marseille-Q3570]|uniref:hypothetical protein n=1 Tax=Bacillus sp. Marseille-Q3570 TaxID=2963522 RepID=UPI0021B7CEFB|nr:hypothetical protein [Bacillus sp. Marseille-Q3570]